MFDRTSCSAYAGSSIHSTSGNGLRLVTVLRCLRSLFVHLKTHVAHAHESKKHLLALDGIQ